jgi:hypothetical protein
MASIEIPSAFGQFSLLLCPLRNEFMQRRVKQTECYGQSVHGLECTLHILLHVGEQLIEGADALGNGVAEDHLAEDEQGLL